MNLEHVYRMSNCLASCRAAYLAKTLAWVLVFVLASASWCAHAVSQTYSTAKLPSQTQSQETEQGRVTYVIAVQADPTASYQRYGASPMQGLEKVLGLADNAVVKKMRAVRLADFIEVIDELSYKITDADQLIILFSGNYLVDLDSGVAYLSSGNADDKAASATAGPGVIASRLVRYLDFIKTENILTLAQIDRIGTISDGHVKWQDSLLDFANHADILRSIENDLADYATASTASFTALTLKKPGSGDVLTLFEAVAKLLARESQSVDVEELANTVGEWANASKEYVELLGGLSGDSWVLLEKQAQSGVQIKYLNNLVVINETIRKAQVSVEFDKLEYQYRWVQQLLQKNRADYQAIVATWSKEGLIGSKPVFDLYRILNTDSRSSILNVDNLDCKRWLVDLGLVLEKSRQSEINQAKNNLDSGVNRRRQDANTSYEIQYHMAGMNSQCIGGK